MTLQNTNTNTDGFTVLRTNYLNTLGYDLSVVSVLFFVLIFIVSNLGQLSCGSI